jgi:hypothetical protein
VLDLVAGGKNGLFIGYANGGQSAYGGPQTVYRLDADGRATALYADPANGIPRDGVVSADGKQLAYRVNYRAGACENFDSVTLVDLATGKATSPELPGAAGKETALSTWFDATGQAWAALVPGPADCTRGTQVPARQVTPQVYREVTGKWVVTTQKALRGADLGSGRTLWFNATVPVDGQQVGALQPGTLTVEAGGAQPEQIADQVLTFAVAP